MNTDIISAVEDAARSVIREKEQSNRRPLCATLQDISLQLPGISGDDITECIHQIGKLGYYIESKTYNQIPMLIKPTSK